MTKGKKVCHITSVHKRYDPRIFEKECRSLAKYGYEVTLLVNDNLENEIIDGVKIISTGFLPKNRTDRFINSNKYIYNKAKEINADIYHLHDPDLLIVGNKLKKGGKKVIFDSHEDVPKQIMDKYWIPKPIRKIVSKFYLMFERRSLGKYDAIISVTPNVVQRLKRINSNTIMVTNYPIVKPFRENENKQKYICFAGGVDESWNHDKIINAIADIDKVKYLLAGKAIDKYISELRKLGGWEKVVYYGFVTREEVKEIYNKALIGIAINKSTQVKDVGTLGNTKLFEFMEAGLPVICTNYSLWEEIVNKYNCGICVDPNNVNEIHDAIEKLINNPKIAKEMGKNGRRAVEIEFNWDSQEKILLDLYMRETI